MSETVAVKRPRWATTLMWGVILFAAGTIVGWVTFAIARSSTLPGLWALIAGVFFVAGFVGFILGIVGLVQYLASRR